MAPATEPERSEPDPEAARPATAEAARDAAAEATGVWLGNRFWHFDADPVPALEIAIGERALAADPARIVAAIREMSAFLQGDQSTSA